MIAAAIVLMQFMISTRAGLVNYVEGQTNVYVHQQVVAGAPIQTGPQSHAEILLNPGSFLRLDQNTSVVLDSAELTNIELHVVEGAVLIESVELDRQTPIRVNTGNLRTAILSPGVYVFSGNTAAVIDGRLRTAGSSITVKKGHEVTAAGGRDEKGTLNPITELAALERWSQQRSLELARANAAVSGDRASITSYTNSAWIYSPLFGGFTFLPLHSYRSYWGQRFVPGAAAAVPGPSGSTAQASPPASASGAPVVRPRPSPGGGAPVRGSSGRPSTGASRGHSGSAGHGGGHGHK
jgi:hypothetical protein